MRLILLLAFMLTPLLTQAATLTQTQQRELCNAAASNGQLAPVMNRLLEQKVLDYRDAGQVLSLSCGDHGFLLGMLVGLKNADNLVYMVIDTGLNVSKSVISHAGNRFSVNDYLSQQAAQGGKTAAFAHRFLKNLNDPSFNPNLLLQVTMR